MSNPAIRQLFIDLGRAALAAPPAQGVDAAFLDLIHNGASAFLDQVRTGEQQDWQPSQVPSTSDFTNAATVLGQRIAEVSPHLPWIPARQDPEGTDRALLSINELFDLGPVVAGFVLVRPGSFYPEHSHAPQELYLTIEGTADWRYGGSDDWASVAPGSVFYNPSSVIHGQRNGTATNISMYVLWD